MWVCKGTSAASVRFVYGAQKALQQFSLGNDLKIAMRLITDEIEVDVSDGIGAVRHSLLGCLVSSLLGARPGDTKVW